MEILLRGEPAQLAFGQRLAEIFRESCVVYLEGDLGAGKTTLVRGLLRGLGYQGIVRSPTYTLLEPYVFGNLPLYHLDLYRLTDPEELEFLGLRDLLAGPSLLFIEWPQRGAGCLPEPDLRIAFAHLPEGRLLRLRSETYRGQAALGRL